MRRTAVFEFVVDKVCTGVTSVMMRCSQGTLAIPSAGAPITAVHYNPVFMYCTGFCRARYVLHKG